MLNFLENEERDEERLLSVSPEISMVPRIPYIYVLTGLLKVGQALIELSPQLSPFGELILRACPTQFRLIFENLLSQFSLFRRST